MNARRTTMTIMRLLCVGVALAGSGCDRAEGGNRNDAGVAVDVAMMAFLSQARALHHEANVREAENDVPNAVRALDRLVNARKPEGLPEVEEVVADTYARMAELHTRLGDLASASRNVEAGLAHAPARTYFRGHLLEVGGIVEEVRATSLADAGQADEASRARTRAKELLRQSVAIQEEVIRGALDEAGARSLGSGGRGNEEQKR